MIAKCPCDHCGENIEFATQEFLSGSSIACPHCGKETFLSVSSKPKSPAGLPPKLPPPKVNIPPPPIAPSQIQKSSGGISRARVKILLGLGIGGAVFFLVTMIPDFQPSAQENEYQKQLDDCSGKMAAPLQIWTNNQAASEQIEQYRKAGDFAASDAAYQRYTSSFDAAQDALKKMTDIEFEFKALKEKQAELKNARQAGMVFKLFLAGGCAVFAFPWLLYLFLVPKKKS
jgi:predicted  nucleic acid-binding Zn-ribbon protein